MKSPPSLTSVEHDWSGHLGQALFSSFFFFVFFFSLILVIFLVLGLVWFSYLSSSLIKRLISLFVRYMMKWFFLEFWASLNLNLGLGRLQHMFNTLRKMDQHLIAENFLEKRQITTHCSNFALTQVSVKIFAFTKVITKFHYQAL